LLSLKRLQVFRLLAGLKHGGAAHLLSKRRGGPINRRKPQAVRNKALSIVRKHCWDFGPTPAFARAGFWRPRSYAKCMRSHSAEALRLWMIEAGIWADRKQRRKQVHQPRHRRDCVGELVQIDGC
jgi:hypothetical protein